MTSSWDEIREKYKENTYALKKCLHITIYGSYYPEEEETKLIEVKDALISDGYTQTTIVKDQLKVNDKPFEISKLFLLESDTNFLIFTRTGKRHGIIAELTYIAESLEMRSKISQCIVFDERKDDGKSSLPALSMDQVNNSRIVTHPFNSTEELKKKANNEAFWQLSRQSLHLKAKCI